jgi:hypothetical protein
VNCSSVLLRGHAAFVTVYVNPFTSFNRFVLCMLQKNKSTTMIRTKFKFMGIQLVEFLFLACMMYFFFLIEGHRSDSATIHIHDAAIGVNKLTLVALFDFQIASC